MYEYKCQEIKKVVDGDTVDIVLNLGFNILHAVRVRLASIDTPESRTRDLDEKARGLLAKEFLKNWLSQEHEKKKIVIKTFKKSKGKFGRVLAEIWVNDVNVNEDMIECYHAVPYSAQNKKEVAELHLKNREKLIEQEVFKP
jgi:micrococcal nuclease